MNSEDTEHLIFGLEGLAGSGKSTMAQTVGHELGIPVIEGGPFYRRLTYAALRDQVPLDDTEKLVTLAATMSVRLPYENGLVLENGKNISEKIRSDEVSNSVGYIWKQEQIRTVVDEQIRQEVYSFDTSIVVGRALRTLVQSAFILRIEIDPSEAERRHAMRTNEHRISVKNRNELDRKTDQMLGTPGSQDEVVDVTFMTKEEQADVLRTFIRSRLPNKI